MTQADLVRLLFAKGDEGFSWKYCFNEQCPLANECARHLSVVYKNADKTDGYAVFLTHTKWQVRTLHANTSCQDGIRSGKMLDELKRRM